MQTIFNQIYAMRMNLQYWVYQNCTFILNLNFILLTQWYMFSADHRKFSMTVTSQVSYPSQTEYFDIKTSRLLIPHTLKMRDWWFILRQEIGAQLVASCTRSIWFVNCYFFQTRCCVGNVQNHTHAHAHKTSKWCWR